MTLPPRFLNKVSPEPTTGCWLWAGAINGRGGYGNFYWKGKSRKAHRVAYEVVVGPVPDGLELDHLCHNRACVNPDHLEPVTRLTNILRGDRKTKRTACKHGHPYTPENTRIDTSRGYAERVCRVCSRLLMRRKRAH